MPYLPDPSRRVAHVILDTVTSIDHQADAALNERAMRSAIEGLDDTGAVVVTADDDPNSDVLVDVSDLFIPVILLVDHLAEELAHERGSDELDIIAELRSYIDALPSR